MDDAAHFLPPRHNAASPNGNRTSHRVHQHLRQDGNDLGMTTSRRPLSPPAVALSRPTIAILPDALPLLPVPAAARSTHCIPSLSNAAATAPEAQTVPAAVRLSRPIARRAVVVIVPGIPLDVASLVSRQTAALESVIHRDLGRTLVNAQIPVHTGVHHARQPRASADAAPAHRLVESHSLSKLGRTLLSQDEIGAYLRNLCHSGLTAPFLRVSIALAPLHHARGPANAQAVPGHPALLAGVDLGRLGTPVPDHRQRSGLATGTAVKITPSQSSQPDRVGQPAADCIRYWVAAETEP
ncbi:serine/threonine protein kinase, CMGC, CDC2/CDK sub [Collariella sp. IMI 366227]|nr:serine/threonine protein kinase, CMGC, CDC2/CDK sub [Collariella sp. IMI 366227]